MVKRSHGTLSKRSRLLRKRAGKKKLGVTKLLKSFKEGQRVSIDFKSGFSGMPHPRYRGKTGIVIEKRGGAYVVQLRDGNAIKRLIIPAVHLEG